MKPPCLTLRGIELTQNKPDPLVDSLKFGFYGRFAKGVYYRDEVTSDFFESLEIHPDARETVAKSLEANKRRHDIRQVKGFADGHAEVKSIPEFNDLRQESIRRLWNIDHEPH